jgi:hypothetical protein
MKKKFTPGPWKAHLNVPTAAIPGHLIKKDDDVMLPVASLWEGGGFKGKPTQIANAHLIAAAPELLEALEQIVKDFEEYPHDRIFTSAVLEVIKTRSASVVKKAHGESDDQG